jgi:hypothetical protein
VTVKVNEKKKYISYQPYTQVSKPIPLPVSVAPIFYIPGHLKGKFHPRTGHESPDGK